MRAHWKVEDGALYLTGVETVFARTATKGISRFLLMEDSRKGRQRIYLRGSPHVRSGTLPMAEGSGGLYNNKENPNKRLNAPTIPLRNGTPSGSRWWATRLRPLNGELVVDNVTMENYWERDKTIYRPARLNSKTRQYAVVQECVHQRTITGPPYE
jgi:hypothetical protein